MNKDVILLPIVVVMDGDRLCRTLSLFTLATDGSDIDDDDDFLWLWLWYQSLLFFDFVTSTQV